MSLAKFSLMNAIFSSSTTSEKEKQKKLQSSHHHLSCHYESSTDDSEKGSSSLKEDMSTFVDPASSTDVSTASTLSTSVFSRGGPYEPEKVTQISSQNKDAKKQQGAVLVESGSEENPKPNTEFFRSKSKELISKSGRLASRVFAHHRAKTSSKLDEQRGLEENDDFNDAFNMFDTNGDGKITAQELHKVLPKLGIKRTKTEIKQMVAEVDYDKNGTIEYLEFANMMKMPAFKNDDEFELKEAFKSLDLDGNGLIDRSELIDSVKKIMSSDSQISTEDVEEMMKEADTDGNGMIDYDEFVTTLVEKRS